VRVLLSKMIPSALHTFTQYNVTEFQRIQEGCP